MSRSISFLNYDEDLISICDVILTSDNKLFAGIKYQQEKFVDAPEVLFKYSLNCNYEFYKTAEKKGIPCLELKLITREIFEKVNEGDAIPVEYLSTIAMTYCKLIHSKAVTPEREIKLKNYYNAILFNENPRLYDIAYNSIIAILETNYKQTGMKYGYESDFGTFIIYLNQDPKSGKMHQIISTYNEFMRHPEYLKNFINAPEVINKNTFLCRELNYRPQNFPKKFRLSNNDSVGGILCQL